MPRTTLPSIGARLIHSGYIGTVRFVGEVDGTQGVWLGVEWDDPTKGKHDGVKDGKRYFACLVPNSGSFIRPSPAISYGTSFMTALVSKYVESTHGAAAEKVILGSSGGAIEVEAVGLDKIRNKLSRLERLREVSLDNEGVASADEPGTIKRTCPNIRGLDLSKNVIPTWDVVALITQELPHLERLALNQNRLSRLEDTDLARLAFKGLKELQLNATLTTWEDSQYIVGCMPELRILEMGYNRLSDLPSLENSHNIPLNTSLEELNLDSNHISCWAKLCHGLRSLTALERLVLTSNGIEEITPPTSPQDTLNNLKHLALSFNRLASWRHIDALPLWCPQLQSLNLVGNSLVEDPDTSRHARQFTTAKIPTLERLDGAAISGKERTDSELFYLSYIATHGPADEDARCLEHPRWKELCLKHGAPDEPTGGAGSRQNTLSSRLIQINIYACPALPPADSAGATRGAPIRSLQVLPSMSGRAFRAKVAKTFKIARAQQGQMRLWLRMPDGNLVEMESTDDMRDLAWWGVDDGSDILLYADKSR
ncbi:RNI-like protein [Obba rivulosa]|uniref:RNI-like protein n=1 Tax=Obba rivulosa TaxID=1052685 RepID=A0A8E2B1H5_9APHY|nr:RNI-like protein [Obba rivulosa]